MCVYMLCIVYVLYCICMYVCMHACMHACMYVCVCVYVCMYVCMYVCIRWVARIHIEALDHMTFLRGGKYNSAEKTFPPRWKVIKIQ